MPFIFVRAYGDSIFAAGLRLCIVPVMLAVGYVLQVGILDRSLRSGVLTPLLATFALSVVLAGTASREHQNFVKRLRKAKKPGP